MDTKMKAIPIPDPDLKKPGATGSTRLGLRPAGVMPDSSILLKPPTFWGRERVAYYWVEGGLDRIRWSSPRLNNSHSTCSPAYIPMAAARATGILT